MSIPAQPGTSFEATFQFATGLTGTVGVQLVDGQGGVIQARSTTGIVEHPSGSGIYTATRTAPSTAGTYNVVADSGGGSPAFKYETLIVVGSLLTFSVPQSTIDRLGRMVAWTSEPVLTPAELDDLLLLARRPDPDGIFPDQTGWTPTFDLNAAAAEGWRWKAGKQAPVHDISTDDQSARRAQIYEHCLLMADRYARKVVGSIRVGAGHATAYDAIANL